MRFRRSDGSARDLGHGDFIGRLWSAALVLDDPRISEAHALVSLRGSQLKLLALRGRFAIDGQTHSEVALVVGQSIELAHGLALDVLEVEVPDAVMALAGPGLPRQVLPPVASLSVGPRVTLDAGYRPDAHAVLWTDGQVWRMRRHDDKDAVAFEAGQTLSIAGLDFVASELPLDLAGQPMTVVEGAIDEPLNLVVRYDTVHIQRAGGVVALDGIAARIFGELTAMGVPAPWEIIARELWPEIAEAAGLRKRWDVALWRMRRKLREQRVRVDLIRPDGHGNVELYLGSRDTLDNQL